MTTCHRVPPWDAEPSEEMVEWLHEMTQDWSGEPDGVTIARPDSTCDAPDAQTARPGDYVVEHGGEYRVYQAPPADLHALAAAVQCDCWPEEVTPEQRRAARAFAYHSAYAGPSRGGLPR